MAGNPGLCGEKAKGLTPCSRDTSSKKQNRNNKRKLVIAIVIPVAASTILLILFGMFLFHRYSRAREDKKDKYLGRKSSFSVWNYTKRIDFKDIVTATDNFDYKFCIGRGGQGSVYKAKLLTGDIFAIKRLHTPDENELSEEYQMKSFESEMHALTEIRHRNIVKMYGISYFDGDLFFVYEFIERGSLAKSLLDDKEAEILSWDIRLKIVRGVANALSYLHHDSTPTIVHRDISRNNILLDMDFEPKISDFGTARLLKAGEYDTTAIVGSYGYIAPGNSQTTPLYYALVSIVFLLTCDAI